MGVMNTQLCLCVPGFLRISHGVGPVVSVGPGEEQEHGHDLDSPTCSYRMGLGVHPVIYHPGAEARRSGFKVIHNCISSSRPVFKKKSTHHQGRYMHYQFW